MFLYKNKNFLPIDDHSNSNSGKYLIWFCNNLDHFETLIFFLVFQQKNLLLPYFDDYADSNLGKYLIWFCNKLDRFKTTNPFVFDEQLYESK